MKNLLKNPSPFLLILIGSALSAFFLAFGLQLDILAPLKWIISCLELIIYIIYYYTTFAVLSDIVLLAVLFCATKLLIISIDKLIILYGKNFTDTDQDMENE